MFDDLPSQLDEQFMALNRALESHDPNQLKLALKDCPAKVWRLWVSPNSKLIHLATEHATADVKLRRQIRISLAISLAHLSQERDLFLSACKLISEGAIRRGDIYLLRFLKHLWRLSDDGEIIKGVVSGLPFLAVAHTAAATITLRSQVIKLLLGSKLGVIQNDQSDARWPQVLTNSLRTLKLSPSSSPWSEIALSIICHPGIALDSIMLLLAMEAKEPRPSVEIFRRLLAKNSEFFEEVSGFSPFSQLMSERIEHIRSVLQNEKLDSDVSRPQSSAVRLRL